MSSYTDITAESKKAGLDLRTIDSPMVDNEFEALSISFTPLIKKTIRYLGLQKDYEEAYQRGQIALWEAWLDFDPQKGYFPPYAKAKITGRLKTFATRSYLDHERFEFFPDNEEIVQESNTANDELSFDIEVFQLSEKERLWIKEFQEGFNTEDMARRHRVSVNTVRSWKKGVKRKFQAHLQKKGVPKEGTVVRLKCEARV